MGICSVYYWFFSLWLEWFACFLVFSRIIQAIGSAMTMANSQGIVTEIFPVKERGKALGLIGTFVSLGSITGPSLGGIIISSLGWEYIFWINLPIGVIAISLAWKTLPKDITLTKTKIDVAGSLLFSIAIILLIGGLLLGQQYGYNNWMIIASILIGLITFISFVMVEYRRESPMLELSIFKNPLFLLVFFVHLSFLLRTSALISYHHFTHRTFLGCLHYIQDIF